MVALFDRRCRPLPAVEAAHPLSVAPQDVDQGAVQRLPERAPAASQLRLAHEPVPGFTRPYAIAVVELDEGRRMMTNITNCRKPPEAVVLDMPVEVAWEKIDDEITLPLFRPAKAQGTKE